MSDVLLFQTPDDGEVEAVNGVVTLTDLPGSAAYISLFGGNQEGATWWADESMTSRTQQLLDELPPTSGNLLRLSDAMSTDLAWMTAAPYGWTVATSAFIPALNRVTLVVDINGTAYQFTQEWTA
jgi:phage gp46-like protein